MSLSSDRFTDDRAACPWLADCRAVGAAQIPANRWAACGSRVLVSGERPAADGRRVALRSRSPAALSLVMLRFFSFILVAAGFGQSLHAQQTVVATSSLSAGGAGRFSDGSAWPVNATFQFELGVFSAGFDPAVQPKSAWGAAWTSARLAVAPAGAVDTWFLDGAVTYFSIQGSSVPLSAVPSAGTQYYVWGYNSRALAESSEWILLTNTAWKVVASSTPQLPVLFDTKDAGTIAITGALTNAGRDLQSAKALAAVDIVAFTGNLVVPVGLAAQLKVSAVGAGISYQWFAGASGDTSRPLANETRSTLVVSSPANSAAYWVRLSSGATTINSPTSVVAVSSAPAQVTATHQLASPGYVAGDRVAIAVTFVASVPVTRLDLAVLLPVGWSFVSDSSVGASRRPSARTADLLEWSWGGLPAGTFTLNYVLSVPTGTTGTPSLAGLLAHVIGGTEYQGLVAADPLILAAGPLYHSGDINRDRRLSLLELTRMIELYATRAGTVRVGSYGVNVLGEDGFVPAPERAIGSRPILSTWHTADTNRDAQIDLPELLRVIELYNQRVANVRTGAYVPRGDTEDGFQPASL
ncbi:MAG: hypothetical protein RL077_1068 [Verrucomicrobiota bacterium]